MFKPYFPRHWQLAAWVYLGLVALGAVIGWWFGAPWLGVSVALTAVLLRVLVQWWRLERAIARNRLRAFEPYGLIAPMVDLIRRGLRRERRQRRRLLDVLQASRDIATAFPDGTVVMARDGRIVWFNKAAKRLLNLRYPDDFGRTLTNLVRSPQVVAWLSEDPFAAPLLDVPAPQDPSLRLAFRMVRYATDMQLLIVRDISNLMKLEQVRRDFVANVSHELRTPLTVIIGYLEAIDSHEIPEYADVLDALRTQSRRMVQIVEDLLTLSRLDAQDRPPEDSIALGPCLTELLHEARALSAERHRIELHCQVEGEIRGNRKDLHSAFLNLISNAVRYTPEQGRIELRFDATADGGGAFSVLDSGPGIAAEHIPRLTERFYRVSASRSRETGGTGLGLAIVKHVIGAHGGRLEIESELGRGSCFRCVLPPERVRLWPRIGAEAARAAATSTPH